jgi:hypothetical protein
MKPFSFILLSKAKNLFSPFLACCFLPIAYCSFFSCQKDELPVSKHNAGNVITETVDMNADYKYQVFYDLKTNTVVSRNLKTAWDLGFETSPNGYHIILNTAKAMFARNMGNTNFSAVTDTIGFATNKKWDEPTGNLYSTAIGNWQSTNTIYMIDRGYSSTGVHQGFRKIQFQNVNANNYTIKFSDLNVANEVTIQINKDSAYNFIFFSFANGGQTVSVEPPKARWDLCFSQYLHVFYNSTTTYLVTGCMLNRYKTYVVMDSLSAFSEIDFSDVGSYALSPNINTIGYNWKTYVSGTYITHPKKNYIIKDSEGIYYKLHFIDFYNPSGLKGNPKWEYQQL